MRKACASEVINSDQKRYSGKSDPFSPRLQSHAGTRIIYAMSVARKLIRLTMITLLAVTTAAASAVDLTALCGDHHLPHAQQDHADDAADGCTHAHTRVGDLGHKDSADGCGCILAELTPTETIPLTRPAPVRDGLASPLPREASHLADLCLASLSITGATPATTAQQLACMAAHRTVVLRV